MILKSRQQKIDYLFGYALRLADELGVYNEVYNWSLSHHSIDEWEAKIDKLEQALTDNGRENVLNY